jgi:hypothetical protein
MHCRSLLLVITTDKCLNDIAVKWMLPGATTGKYEVFGGTMLADRVQDCSSMGGAVRVSNRLMIPNNWVSFSGEKVDGTPVFTIESISR